MKAHSHFKHDPLKILQEIIALDEKEEKPDFEMIKNTIHSGSSEEKEKLARAFKENDIFLLWKFAENDEKINTFLDTHSDLQLQWKKHLTEIDYYAEEMPSLSYFSRLKGLCYLQKDKDTEYKHTVILDKACELGMYEALVTRLKRADTDIRTAAKDGKKIESVLRRTHQDAFQVSNLYGALGCINASNILISIAQYFFQSSDDKIENERFQQRNNISWLAEYDNDQSLPRYIKILKIAVDLFYKAKIQFEKDLNNSKKIIASFQPGGDLFAGLEKFNDGSGGEKYLKALLADLKVPLPDSFCERTKAKAAAALQLQPKPTP